MQVRLTASRKVPPEKLEAAQIAFDKGVRSVQGIAKAAGITRTTARAMLARVGNVYVTPGSIDALLASIPRPGEQ